MMWIFFWIIGKIPATFWMILSIAGAVLYVLSGVLGRLPTFKTYSWALKPLSILVMFIGVYMYGGASINDHYQKLIKEYEQKIAIAEQQSAAVNTVIEERLVTQNKYIKDTQIVYQDKIIEIAKEVDGQCKVHPEVIKILNDASDNPLAKFKDEANRAAGDKK
jgi:predicted PurR-regulated permease PerM